MASPMPGQVVSPHKSGPRYQMLDVWRGVVAILVVMEHAGVVLWGGGPTGTGWDRALTDGLTWALRLDLGGLLFFVMSGFCIASSLDSARRRGDSPLRFLYRRFWRIFPTYWAALLAFVAFVAATDALGVGIIHRNGVSLELASPASMGRSEWIGNLTLTETWRPHVAGSTYSNVYTRVAWSLCYQEQFYAVCALLLWLVPGRLAKALAIATVLFVGFRLAAEDVGRFDPFSGTLLVYWHVFAVGLAVYWRLLGSADVPIRRRRVVEVGLVALAAVTGVATQSVSQVAPYLFGVALILLYRWDAKGASLGCLGPIRACGRRSYSIYLIHLPITNVGNGLLVMAGIEAPWARALVIVPVVAAASVGAGWAFHAAVERHFLGLPPAINLKRPGGGRWRGGSFPLGFGGGATIHPA